MRSLVLVTGPIGAGKSTVASLLGRRVAAAGRSVAVVDEDELAFQQGGVAAVDELWRRAAVATAGLVGGWFAAGTEVVIAHGPLTESGGYEAVARARPHGAAVHHVLLEVPPEVALARVADDPDRGLSRDPAFLHAAHERFQALAPTLPPPHHIVDTTRHTPDDIAATLAAALLAP